MTTDTGNAVFEQGLREERVAMQSFLQLLEKEQALLIQGNADGVQAQIKAKTEWLQALARHAERRRAFLKARQQATDRGSMSAWLSQPDMPAALRGEWEQLLTMTDAARAVNETNGALIAARLHANQLAITALQSDRESGRLYGENGRAVIADHGRKLGIA